MSRLASAEPMRRGVCPLDQSLVAGVWALLLSGLMLSGGISAWWLIRTRLWRTTANNGV